MFLLTHIISLLSVIHTIYSIIQTPLPFDDEELSLLNKGLKYNLNQKRKHWLSDLAFEAEIVVTLLPPCDQEHIRYRIAHNLQKLYKQHNSKQTVLNKTAMHERKTINRIKKKLIEGPCILVCIILYVVCMTDNKRIICAINTCLYFVASSLRVIVHAN